MRSIARQNGSIFYYNIFFFDWWQTVRIAAATEANCSQNVIFNVKYLWKVFGSRSIRWLNGSHVVTSNILFGESAVLLWARGRRLAVGVVRMHTVIAYGSGHTGKQHEQREKATQVSLYIQSRWRLPFMLYVTSSDWSQFVRALRCGVWITVC